MQLLKFINETNLKSFKMENDTKFIDIYRIFSRNLFYNLKYLANN